MQLPDKIIDEIYTQFLYKRFVKVYSVILNFAKFPENKHSRYLWSDPQYRSFLLSILKQLEPRKEEANVKLIEELDEFSEVIFFMTGFYVIGYTINNKNVYLPEYYQRNVIGAFGVTNNKRAIFIYKTTTVCEGFFIRKKNWIDKVINGEDHQDIVVLLKKKLQKNYEETVKTKVFQHKMTKLNKIVQRSDY